MNRIVIIGNGFDLAHDLPTKYEDFINHLKDEFAVSIKSNLFTKTHTYKYTSKYFALRTKSRRLEDSSEVLCTNIEQLQNADNNWGSIMSHISLLYQDGGYYKFDPLDSKFGLKTKNPLVQSAMENCKNKTWGGIENDYRIALSKIITSSRDDNEKLTEMISLNNYMNDLTDDLIKYLNGLNRGIFKERIMSALYPKPLITWRDKRSNTTQKSSKISISNI